MSVTEVQLSGIAFALSDGKVKIYGNGLPRAILDSGSAVEIAPGLYLSAQHVFDETFFTPNGIFTTDFADGVFYVSPNVTTFSKSDPSKRIVTGSNSVTGIIPLTNFMAGSSVPQQDIVAFKAATPDDNPTGIVLFLSPTLENFQKYFPSLSFTGYPVPENAEGTIVLRPVSTTNVSTSSVSANGTFVLHQKLQAEIVELEFTDLTRVQTVLILTIITS